MGRITASGWSARREGVWGEDVVCVEVDISGVPFDE